MHVRVQATSRLQRVCESGSEWVIIDTQPQARPAVPPPRCCCAQQRPPDGARFLALLRLGLDEKVCHGVVTLTWWVKLAGHGQREQGPQTAAPLPTWPSQ